MDTQDLLNNHAMNMFGQLTWIELDLSSFPEHSGILNIKCKSESFQIKVRSDQLLVRAKTRFVLPFFGIIMGLGNLQMAESTKPEEASIFK